MTFLLEVANGKQVTDAIGRWEEAFQALRQTEPSSAEGPISIKEHDIWLRRGGWERKSGYRYFNTLGTVSGGLSKRNLVIEVNPPENWTFNNGFQGVVAADEAGKTWLLHRGKITVGRKKIDLKDYIKQFSQFSPAIFEVKYQNDTPFKCVVVANLSDKNAEIVSSTKRFVDFCKAVKVSVNEESNDTLEVADVLEAASLFEEAQGPYFRRAQDEKEIKRIHADVHDSLVAAMKVKKLTVANNRVGSLGPDLFTVGEGKRFLFEIKTSSGASDVLKAVGQLFVYEKALNKAYCKVMVLPADLPDRYQRIISSLGINVVRYKQAGNGYAFDWPDNMRFPDSLSGVL